MVDPTRGVLFPRRLPQFHRLPADAASDLVSWFWIPEWTLPDGETSRQEIVAYPAVNLVVEQEAVTLSGASTRLTHRELRGTGWAVGALLRPAAVAALTRSAADLLDREITLDEPELHRGVCAEMVSGAGHRESAVSMLSRWLIARVGPLDASAVQANALADVLMGPEAAGTLDEAATRLAVSTRTLQRMAHRHVGMSPAAMIRRRRLQEAAERLRADPSADLAEVAAELGYADHAHLARAFRAVLGFTPSDYRAAAVD